MVKFSKQLEAQLIPEWKGAFVNYWQLKKDVKKIKIFRQNAMEARNSDGQGSIFGIFGYTSESIGDYLKSRTQAWMSHGSDCNVIQVYQRDEDVYETALLQQLDEAEAVKAFLARLDSQLNKVNQFYRSKEAEFLERGETLKRQMQILIDLKAVLREQGMLKTSPSSTEGSENGLISSKYDGASTPVEGDEEEDGVQVQNEKIIAAFEKNGVKFFDSCTRGFGNRLRNIKKENCKTKCKLSGNGRGNFGRHVSMRVDIPANTASRTISAITQMLWEDLVKQSKSDSEGGGSMHINKKKVQTAEKIIRGAFVELYRGLGLLKTYSSLNMVAFGKILKKFDKVCEQQVAPVYLKAVERSYFNSSDEIVKLGDEVESTFIKYFAEDDRKKAMTFLRPKQTKDSHAVTFFIGLFTGLFLALFVGYAILAHLSGMYTDPHQSDYIELVYPVFSMFALLNLHIFLYGCNIFMWRSARINYSFIFEFSPNTELKYRDAFLICSTFMTLVVGAMVAQLTLRTKGVSLAEIDVIPGFLLLVFVSLLFCPFDVLYRSTRYCFLKVIRNIILAPLYKVVMTDFFMADQLTSQVQLLRHLEFIICYYLAGSFRSHDYGTCNNNKLYREMVYVVSFLPYYWRALQCARRWFEEGDIAHLANLGKYVSAIFAAGARLTYGMEHNTCWLVLVVLTSTIATIYQLYWDFVKDWGLLNPRSKNPWLRDQLILRHKIVYFISIAFNFILRLAWVHTIMHLNLGENGCRMTEFALASLEIIRRGHWNFYRIENEHLNNVGKYRAVKTVPLPFRELEMD